MQRHWPCYQNIHVLLSQGIELQESELETFMSGLLAHGILVDRGSPGAESFRFGDDVFITRAEIPPTNSNLSNLSNSSNSSLNEFINNKFYETLTNRIKAGVEVNSLMTHHFKILPSGTTT